MSCMDSESEIYRDLFQQFKTASLEKIKFYLNTILPLLSENMVLSAGLWDGWDEKTRIAYTYYANLNGPEAVKMEITLGMALKNLSRSKEPNAYKAQPKINLFS